VVAYRTERGRAKGKGYLCLERIDRMLHRHGVRVFAESFLLHWRSRLLALGHDGEKRREEKRGVSLEGMKVRMKVGNQGMEFT